MNRLTDLRRMLFDHALGVHVSNVQNLMHLVPNAETGQGGYRGIYWLGTRLG